MQEILKFLAPLLWLVPVIIAVVNRVRSEAPKLPSWSIPFVAIGVSFVAIVTVIYFTDMPVWGKAIVASGYLGLSTAGVYDISKLFGTIRRE